MLRRAVEDALHSVSEKPRLYLQGNIFYNQTNGMPDFHFKQGVFDFDLLDIIHVGIVDSATCQRSLRPQSDPTTVDGPLVKNLKAPPPSSGSKECLRFLV